MKYKQKLTLKQRTEAICRFQSSFFKLQFSVATLPPLLPGEEIYDIKAPVTVPFPWMKLFLQVIGWIFAIYLAWRLFQWLTKPRSMVIPPPPPPPDPLEEALKSLNTLKNSTIWHEGRIKDICEALTTILKRYLRDKFRLGIGPAATSDELLRDLRNSKISTITIEKTAKLLNICDAVKFARGTLGSLTMEQLFQGIKELITEVNWK